MDISDVINKHGAKSVYEAACAQMAGDMGEALRRIGVESPSLATAFDIQSAAYERLTAEDKAREHWDVQQALKGFDE